MTNNNYTEQEIINALIYATNYLKDEKNLMIVKLANSVCKLLNMDLDTLLDIIENENDSN